MRIRWCRASKGPMVGAKRGEVWQTLYRYYIVWQIERKAGMRDGWRLSREYLYPKQERRRVG